MNIVFLLQHLQMSMTLHKEGSKSLRISTNVELNVKKISVYITFALPNQEYPQSFLFRYHTYTLR